MLNAAAMHFVALRCRRGAASAIAALALVLLGEAEVATAGEPAAPPSVELRWRLVDVGEADKVVIALALDRAGRLAVGDARGVVFGFPGNPMRRVALRGEVRDLAFFGDDTEHATALLAATDLGLYRISSDGRVESIAPGPGPTRGRSRALRSPMGWSRRRPMRVPSGLRMGRTGNGSRRNCHLDL